MWLTLLTTALAAQLDYAEVLRLGLRESPSAQANVATQDQRRAGALALTNPSVELERLPSDTELRLTVPLAPPGLVGTAQARGAADLRYEADQAALAATLGEAYVALARAEALAAITAGNAALGARLADGVERRLAAGEISAVEAGVARSLAASLRIDALRAEQERQAAALALAALLNLDEPVESAGWPALVPPPEDPAASVVVTAAFAEADAARAQARAQALGVLSPWATVGTVSGGAEPGWILGVGVQLPLGSVAQARAAGAGAALALAEAEATRATQRAALGTARARYALALEADALFEPQSSLPEALLTAFEGGELSLGEYGAQLALVTQAQLADAEARAERERAALALWAAQGLIPELP